MKPLIRGLRGALSALRGGRERQSSTSQAALAKLDDRISYRIDRFSCAHGVVKLAGRIAVCQSRIRSAEFILSSGASYPVALASAGGSVMAFDEAIIIGDVPITEVPSSSLRVKFDDGSVRAISSLGAPPEDDPGHAITKRFRTHLREMPAGQLLEVGSRARSGIVRRDWVPEGWEYTGLDIMEGANVDVVGDAHRLSDILPAESFDAVMAFSVLEHLLMPWKFATELNRVLKNGAIGAFTTHQCWPMHEEPWDYWRFSDTAWSGILNEATGFEILATGLGERIVLVAERMHAITAFQDIHSCWGMSAVLFRKIGPARVSWDVDVKDITGTAYPT